MSTAAPCRRPRTVQDDDRRSGQGVQRDHGSDSGGAANLPAVQHLHRLREPVLVHHWAGALVIRRSAANEQVFGCSLLL